MKITKSPPISEPFKPVVITLETQEEVNALRRIVNNTLVPEVLILPELIRCLLNLTINK